MNIVQIYVANSSKNRTDEIILIRHVSAKENKILVEEVSSVWNKKPGVQTEAIMTSYRRSAPNY
jgi:hypothetical protein